MFGIYYNCSATLIIFHFPSSSFIYPHYLSFYSFIYSFYFAIKQKYNNSIQKYIKDNIQYSN